jgi:hypothetical protein
VLDLRDGTPVSAPARFGDLAAVYLARTWHQQGDQVTDSSNVQRGDRLNVVTDDGDRHDLVVTSDPRTNPDGTVTFDAANAERHAAMERLEALTRWPDQPASADAAVERLEVHHWRGRQPTDEEALAVAQRLKRLDAMTSLGRGV